MTFRTRAAEWRAQLSPALDLLLFGVAIYILDRVLHEYHLRDIAEAIRRVPASGIIASVVISAAGYLALILYDYIALRFVGRPLPLRTVLIPSFASFAVSNSAPASVVTAGGVRYRLYEPHGLTAQEAAVIAGFNVLTYSLGLCTLSGLLLSIDRARPAAVRLLGLPLLAASAAYLLLARFRPGAVHVMRFTIRIPRLKLALAQLAISLADWVLSSGALYVLLITLAPLSYVGFTTTFVVAQFGSLLLPIPGGLGVFEAVMLLLRPAGTPASLTLAALLMYRVIYYLLPLMTAALLLGWRWLNEVRRSENPADRVRAQVFALAPKLVAWTTFLAGMLLLISGVVPVNDRRLSWLAELLPLGIIEATHLLGSIVGAVLIIMAWGIELRSRLAYRVVCVLFGAGVLLSAVRGLNYPLAILFSLSLTVLVVASRFFPRTTSLVHAPMTPAWKATIGAVLIGLAWVAVILYRHANLGDEVWWRFALFGNAPRSLRASVAAAVMILLFGIARMLAGRADTGRRRNTDE